MFVLRTNVLCFFPGVLRCWDDLWIFQSCFFCTVLWKMSEETQKKHVNVNLLFPYVKTNRTSKRSFHILHLLTKISDWQSVFFKARLPNKVSSGGWFCFFGQPRSNRRTGILDDIPRPDITLSTSLYSWYRNKVEISSCVREKTKYHHSIYGTSTYMFMSFQCTSIPKWDFYRNLTSNQPFHVAKKLFLLRFVSSGNSCCLGRSSDWDGRKTSWWLNQPIWTILVKLDHFPKDRGENKQNIWNHHLENFPVFSSRLMDFWGNFKLCQLEVVLFFGRVYI